MRSDIYLKDLWFLSSVLYLKIVYCKVLSHSYLLHFCPQNVCRLDFPP